MPPGACSVEHCNRPIRSRGLCKPHYDEARREGRLAPAYGKRTGSCSKDDCDRPQKARSLCAVHYNVHRVETGAKCTVNGCDRRVLSRGWCAPHYQRWRTHGAPDAVPVWSDLEAKAPEGSRFCRTCREYKPLDEFRVRTDVSDGCRTAKCKPCASREWHENREYHLAQKAARNFGVTAERYAELMAGGCHVCGRTEHQSGRRLHIDHCHDRGVVRGALCTNCNTALGLADDSAERLRALADYLERAHAMT